jgi:hypothetical protein
MPFFSPIHHTPTLIHATLITVSPIQKFVALKHHYQSNLTATTRKFIKSDFIPLGGKLPILGLLSKIA